MKKKQLILILGVLLLLIGLVVCLLLLFLGLYGNSQITLDTPKDTTIIDATDPVGYLMESWYFHDGHWDRSSNTITAIRTFDLTYAEGQKVGAQVFTGDLAPETYLSQALTIAADLNSRFSMKDVMVVISFRSSDGMELFSVDSIGTVSTCWGSGS